MSRPNLEEHIRESLELGPEYVVHQLAQEIVRQRRRIVKLEKYWDERNAAVSKVEQLINEADAFRRRIAELEAGGVVVADLTLERMNSIIGSGTGIAISAIRDGFRIGWKECEKSSRAIPSARVLREGQVAVGAQELGLLRDFAALRMSAREYDRLESVRDAHEDAIRAQAGKDAT